MARHVTDDALMEVLDGAGGEAAEAHVATCSACAARLDEAREALARAREADVPEPPALYWEALRRNVGRRIAEEPRRFRWGRLLLPLAAAAALVAVAVGVVGRGGPAARSTPAPAVLLPAWSPLPPADEDDAFDVLAGLAMADGGLAEWDEGRGLEALLATLTDEESQALADALRRAREEGDS